MKMQQLRLTNRHRGEDPVAGIMAICIGLALTCLLAACATPFVNPKASGVEQTRWPAVLQAVNPKALTNPTEATERAITALQEAGSSNLQAASKGLNQALQLDPGNAALHFFNGFVYHLLARSGDAEKVSLAVEGYRQAIRFNPSHWVAHEFLGLAYMEQRQYKAAQRSFSDALMLRPDDSRLHQDMLVASYLAGDPQTACGMADRLGASTSLDRALLRSSAAVYASCSRFDLSEQAIATMSAVSPDEVSEVKSRLEQWKNFYKNHPSSTGLIKTQFGGMGGFGGANPGAPQFPQMPQSGLGNTAGMGAFGGGFGGGFGGYGGFGGMGANQLTPVGEGRMVLLDVVMLRTEDSISTAKGVNLMNALTLQFGSASGPAYSKSYSNTVDDYGARTSTLLSRTVTVPALTYTLNLANASANLNEVLARPTLAAVEGQKSEFFSGTSLSAAVVSGSSTPGYGGGSVQVEKRYGVKLSVQPQWLPNGMIRLAIDASRTFLKPPSNNINFQYKLEISEILANANVVMRLGDTLVLGGLSEKESTSDRDGTPVLQDIPGVQYLFSRQTRTDFQRSVLILITPRPTAYTWSEEELKASRDEQGENSLDVLRARYGDWFKPYPNLAAVFHHLNDTELYREFRTSDVTLERWDRMDSTAERLKQALKFLYY